MITLTIYSHSEEISQDVKVEYIIDGDFITYARIIDPVEIEAPYTEEDVLNCIAYYEGMAWLKMGCRVNVVELQTVTI